MGSNVSGKSKLATPLVASAVPGMWLVQYQGCAQTSLVASAVPGMCSDLLMRWLYSILNPQSQFSTQICLFNGDLLRYCTNLPPLVVVRSYILERFQDGLMFHSKNSQWQDIVSIYILLLLHGIYVYVLNCASSTVQPSNIERLSCNMFVHSLATNNQCITV